MALDLNYAIVLPGSAIFMTLLSLNVWFIRRLVIKIERIDRLVIEKFPLHQLEILNMCKQIRDIEGEIKQLIRRFEDVANLRERIAVLESYLKSSNRKAKNEHT